MSSERLVGLVSLIALVAILGYALWRARGARRDPFRKPDDPGQMPD